MTFLFFIERRKPRYKLMLVEYNLNPLFRLKEKLAEREARVATLETEISEKEARVATLENRINELQLNIANSQQTTQDQVGEVYLLMVQPWKEWGGT